MRLQLLSDRTERFYRSPLDYLPRGGPGEWRKTHSEIDHRCGTTSASGGMLARFANEEDRLKHCDLLANLIFS